MSIFEVSQVSLSANASHCELLSRNLNESILGIILLQFHCNTVIESLTSFALLVIEGYNRCKDGPSNSELFQKCSYCWDDSC